MTEPSAPGTRGPKPTSTRKPVTYKIDPAVASFARQYARYHGIQIADLIEQAVTDWCAMNAPDGPRTIVDATGTATVEPPAPVKSIRVRDYQLALRGQTGGKRKTTSSARRGQEGVQEPVLSPFEGLEPPRQGHSV